MLVIISYSSDKSKFSNQHLFGEKLLGFLHAIMCVFYFKSWPNYSKLYRLHFLRYQIFSKYMVFLIHLFKFYPPFFWKNKVLFNIYIAWYGLHIWNILERLHFCWKLSCFTVLVVFILMCSAQFCFLWMKLLWPLCLYV